MSPFLSFLRVCKKNNYSEFLSKQSSPDMIHIYKPLIIYCTRINRSNISTLLSTTAGLKLPKRLELAYINTARCNRRGAINKEACINTPSIKTHPSWDTCLLPARGYSRHAKNGPQELFIKMAVKPRNMWQKTRGSGGPRRPSGPSERCLEDDTRVLGRVRVCHWLFVGVNLEAHQGSSVTEHKHTVQSNLGSVRLWFMTDPVRAGWRDLSPAEACKSGLFSLVNNCEIWGVGCACVCT